jgi:hypothetical protein
MSRVVSPTTQIADTAVNRASGRGVATPAAEAAGSISRVVVMRTKTRKIRIVTNAGELVRVKRARFSLPEKPGWKRSL